MGTWRLHGVPGARLRPAPAPRCCGRAPHPATGHGVGPTGARLSWGPSQPLGQAGSVPWIRSTEGPGSVLVGAGAPPEVAHAPCRGGAPRRGGLIQPTTRVPLSCRSGASRWGGTTAGSGRRGHRPGPRAATQIEVDRWGWPGPVGCWWRSSGGGPPRRPRRGLHASLPSRPAPRGDSGSPAFGRCTQSSHCLTHPCRSCAGADCPGRKWTSSLFRYRARHRGAPLPVLNKTPCAPHCAFSPTSLLHSANCNL